jgi:hypothetical protein
MRGIIYVTIQNIIVTPAKDKPHHSTHVMLKSFLDTSLRWYDNYYFAN